MKLIKKEILGWFFISVITTYCFAGSIFLFYEIKKDLSILNNHYIKKLVDDTNNNKILLSEIINSISYIKKNISYQSQQTTSSNNETVIVGEYIGKILLDITNIKKLFENSIPIKTQLLEIKNSLFTLNNQEIENAINQIQKMYDQKISTFAELNELFEQIVHQFYYDSSGITKKLLSRWLVIVSNDNLTWNSISKIRKSINNKKWQTVLDIAKQELSSIEKFASWIQKLEDIMIIEKNIDIIYNEVSKHIVRVSE